MTRMSLGTFGLSAAALAAALCVADATPASAQCCPTPTVAYSPVVVQPQTAVVNPGWYPGAMIDRWRMRRWAATTAAVAPAPTWTVGYAPATTAAFAPVAHTASYTPYITAYAPLQTQVVQTVPAVSSGCSTCAQTTTVSYAPTTVFRPVELTPVVATPACSTCTVAAPCNACSACSTTVSQVSYVEGAAPADCPGCAATSGTPYYPEAASTQPPQAAPPQGAPPTPQPALKPEVAAPPATTYGEPASGANPSQEQSVVPGPAPEEEETGPEADPAAADSSTFFEAPPLLGPQNDRTANRPTVDVHTAVYSRPVREASRVSTTAAKVAPAVDANGWYAVD